MKDYIIITDSCCDMVPELAEKSGIYVIPMLVTMDGREYHNYLDGRELDYKLFYKQLRSGIDATTSAINIDTFTKTFESYLQKDIDILYLSFSSGLSSTYQTSLIVADELMGKYPQHKIYCVDTLSASSGEGLLVYLAAIEKQKGKTIEEVRDYAENNKLNLCHWFTVDDLNHLKRGGRVSAATALVGSMLNIKPVLHVDNEGHLINMEKSRGRKASIINLFGQMKKTAISPEKQTIFIGHGDCEDDAKFLAEMIEKEYNIKEIYINPIGPIIGAHSGPGTLALFFIGSHR